LPRSLLDSPTSSGNWDPNDVNTGFDPADLEDPTFVELLTCPDYCGTETTPYQPGSCMRNCEDEFTFCKNKCDTSKAAQDAGCISNFPPGTLRTDCLADSAAQWDTCMNDPAVDGCNPVYAQCKDDCECDINSIIFECDQPFADLILALDAEATAQNYKGSCVEAEFPPSEMPAGTLNGFFDLVFRSIPEAQNQIAKFTQRRIFLEARVNEIKFIIEVLTQAIDRLEAFLRGPAADLIRERISYNDERLPYHVVYGWQGDPTPRGGNGLWHIVKVDGRIPGRCDNACDTSQTTSANWPRVRSYKRWLGTSRCYELVDTDGTVKLRVTRYDEQRASNPFFFPNGVRIWDFRNHPDRNTDNFAQNIDTLCPPFVSPHPTVKNDADGNPIYAGAFLVNGPNRDGNPWPSKLPSDNLACWGRVNELLGRYGVKTETCAKYYYQESERPGFDYHFIPCRNF